MLAKRVAHSTIDAVFGQLKAQHRKLIFDAVRSLLTLYEARQFTFPRALQCPWFIIESIFDLLELTFVD